MNIQRLWIYQGYTGFCVNYILKIHGILSVLSSEYAKVLNVSGVWIFHRVCQGSLRKRYIIDSWQGSEYSSSSEYGNVLNLPGLHKVLKKNSLVLKWQGYRSCEFCANFILEIHGIINMPQVLNIPRLWMY